MFFSRLCANTCMQVKYESRSHRFTITFQSSCLSAWDSRMSLFKYFKKINDNVVDSDIDSKTQSSSPLPDPDECHVRPHPKTVKRKHGGQLIIFAKLFLLECESQTIQQNFIPLEYNPYTVLPYLWIVKKTTATLNHKSHTVYNYGHYVLKQEE